MVHWGSKRSHHFAGRSEADAGGEDCRRLEGFPQEAAVAQLCWAGAAAALGTPAGEGGAGWGRGSGAAGPAPAG